MITTCAIEWVWSATLFIGWKNRLYTTILLWRLCGVSGRLIQDCWSFRGWRLHINCSGWSGRSRSLGRLRARLGLGLYASNGVGRLGGSWVSSGWGLNEGIVWSFWICIGDWRSRIGGSVTSWLLGRNLVLSTYLLSRCLGLTTKIYACGLGMWWRPLRWF